MLYLIIITSIIVAYLRGTKEGMVMIKKDDKMAIPSNEHGVRIHQWFGQYHLISLSKDLLLISIGAISSCLIMLCVFGVIKEYSLNALVTLPFLLLFLIWDTYEYAYSQSRFKLWINPKLEHITLIDFVSWHEGSETMHILRAIGIIGMIGWMI